jgi:hypothetical protein
MAARHDCAPRAATANEGAVTHYRSRLLAAIAARKRARTALMANDIPAYLAASRECAANYERLDQGEQQIYADIMRGRAPDPTEPPC